MNPFVVGIAGRAGAGKSLFGALLASELLNKGYTVALDAFATPIKRQARKLLGYNGEKGERMRWALQTMGDQMTGKDGNGLIRRLNCNWTSDFEVLIVTDVRRRREADFVEATGMLVLLTSPNGGLDGPAGKHVTEAIGENLAGLEVMVMANDGNVGNLAFTAARVAGAVEAEMERRAEASTPSPTPTPPWR